MASTFRHRAGIQALRDMLRELSQPRPRLRFLPPHLPAALVIVFLQHFLALEEAEARVVDLPLVVAALAAGEVEAAEALRKKPGCGILYTL